MGDSESNQNPNTGPIPNSIPNQNQDMAKLVYITLLRNKLNSYNQLMLNKPGNQFEFKSENCKALRDV